MQQGGFFKAMEIEEERFCWRENSKIWKILIVICVCVCVCVCACVRVCVHVCVCVK